MIDHRIKEQLMPKVCQAIKYLVADGSYTGVSETGRRTG